MIKADGNLLAFFERPIAGALGVLTLAVLVCAAVRGVFFGVGFSFPWRRSIR